MAKKVRLGPKNQVYKGTIFTILQRDVFFPNGQKKLFEYCVRPDSVTVLPFDSKGRLLLIKEYRHGQHDVWFLPAGRIDKGESPLEAAKREYLSKPRRRLKKATSRNSQLSQLLGMKTAM